MSRGSAESLRVSVEREGATVVLAVRIGGRGFVCVMPLAAARSVVATMAAATQDEDDANYSFLVGGELSLTQEKNSHDPRD